MTATTEPTRITAGDTVAWTKTISDYPASAGWVLKYRLINPSGHYDITASASGSDHAVSIDAASSAGWAAGDYALQGVVEKAGQRFTVFTERIAVAPNLMAEAGAFDSRSAAEKILANLLANYQTASLEKAFVQEYEIAGRRIKFNAKADWLLEINFWKREVARERRAARAAAGLGSGTRVYERF